MLRSPVLLAVQVVTTEARKAANQTGAWKRVRKDPACLVKYTYGDEQSLDSAEAQSLDNAREEVLESHALSIVSCCTSLEQEWAYQSGQMLNEKEKV